MRSRNPLMKLPPGVLIRPGMHLSTKRTVKIVKENLKKISNDYWLIKSIAMRKFRYRDINVVGRILVR